MSKKKKRKNNAGGRQRFTPLTSHIRHGSQLRGQLSALNMDVLNWDRDLLPEYLWIASLEASRAGIHWPNLYNAFMDAVDTFASSTDSPLLGLITDFSMVPQDRREEFHHVHQELIGAAFLEPFGRILAYYPDSPAYWLVRQGEVAKGGSLDPSVDLPVLRNLVMRLLPGKDLRAGHIRAVPLNRLFKHNKIVLQEGMSVIELLPKYPVGCTEAEQYRVQQFARMITNMHYQRETLYRERSWPKYFWRHNYDLAPCIQHNLGISVGSEVEDTAATKIYEALEQNAQAAIQYLQPLSLKVKFDLYDPDRDEVLLGLFARVTRLYVLIVRDPALWARDIAGIMLRCLADTAITFVYLARRGSPEEVAAFRRYGEGKEKLLMLHLQDTYPGGRSLEGATSTQLADELGGGFSPELIDIELGNWTKKSARTLAFEAGMEDFYRLVYDPTSSDVHGTWVSLKNSNLARCAEPLHRFHRLPTYTEPPLYLNSVIAIQRLYKHCLETAQTTLGFPPTREPIVDIPGARSDDTAGHDIGQ